MLVTLIPFSLIFESECDEVEEPFAAAANAVLWNHQVLPHRQGKLYHVFDHTTNFFLSHCCRLTRMNTRWVCSGGPKNTPRSMGQSQ